jgi:hypothetical protein
MYTPNGTGAKGHYRGTPRTGSRTDKLWRCVECLVGGVTAGVVVLLSLPTLQELARPLGALSTTMTTSVALLAWLFAWAVVRTSREWIAEGDG